MQKLNKKLLNNQWVKEEITRDSIKYFRMNGNENTTYHNLWDTTKAFLKENFMVVNIYIIFFRSQTNILTFHLKN